MATIPRTLLDELTKNINTLSDATQKAILAEVKKIGAASFDEMRQKLLEIYLRYVGAAGEIAASLSSSFYDDVREFSVGERLQGYAPAVVNEKAAEGALRYFLKYYYDGDQNRFHELIASRADRDLKKISGDTVMRLGQQDRLKPKYARVPTGLETCQFCLMLASRGFVYQNAKAAGEDGHYHANCDCRIMPGFAGMEVEGYDPDELYRKWKDSGFKPETKPGTHESKYEIEGKNGLPSFKDFNGVKTYLYGADTFDELAERISVLEQLYGEDSEQIQSLSVINVVKTAKKILEKESQYED